MRAVSIKNQGENYSLEVKEANKPALKPNEVLIHVKAAGVNRADIYQSQGKYPPPEGAPNILGLEVSGEVVEMHETVKKMKVGEQVCALLPAGGYQEYIAVPEWRMLSIPKGIDLTTAAALPEAVFTVYFNLFMLGKLKPSHTILLHGGASGIGTFAIQIAKAIGATVITTAGSDEKCELCESLGADLAIQYKAQDFVEEVEKFTESEGVDLILDMVGGDYIQKNLKALKRGGTLLSIAFIEGAKAEINAAPMMLKQLTWKGSTLRSQTEEQIYDLSESIREVIWPMIEDDRVKPVIDSVYPIENAIEAHKRMTEFGHAGKIILTF